LYLAQQVEHLMEAREQSKRMYKREEQLMMSAIYEVGVQMQQRILTQPASTTNSPAANGSPANSGSPYSPAQSWLSRTRQQRRRGLT
jgi:hypothetical protein